MRKITLTTIGILALWLNTTSAQTTDTYTLDYAQFDFGGSTGAGADYEHVDTLQITGDDIKTQISASYVLENVIENDPADRANIPLLGAGGTSVRISYDAENPLPEGAAGFRVMRAEADVNGSIYVERQLVVRPYEYLNPELCVCGVFIDIIEPHRLYSYKIEVEMGDGTLSIPSEPFYVMSTDSNNADNIMSHLMGVDCVMSLPGLATLDTDEDGFVDIADFLWWREQEAGQQE